MQCPKCKKSELEISDVNMGMDKELLVDRQSLRVKLACSDNSCPFFKVLELSLDDIIGIGRSPETEAETKAAIARAIEG
ncbi:MAG: hypothetical protein Q8P40_09580 [Nitrospirota bacterium]|nr:hypothetical protein [Nitrospirota bacterium]